MRSKKSKKKINGGDIIKNMFGGFSETFKGTFDIVNSAGLFGILIVLILMYRKDTDSYNNMIAKEIDKSKDLIFPVGLYDSVLEENDKNAIIENIKNLIYII